MHCKWGRLWAHCLVWMWTWTWTRLRVHARKLKLLPHTRSPGAHRNCAWQLGSAIQHARRTHYPRALNPKPSRSEHYVPTPFSHIALSILPEGCLSCLSSSATRSHSPRDRQYTMPHCTRLVTWGRKRGRGGRGGGG